VHLWIVRMQEPLPAPDGRGRLMRAGQLALAAVERGWRVTWWTSLFDHYGGDWHRPENIEAARERGIALELLRGVAYRRPVSPGRFLHDLLAAAAFLRRARRRAAPDAVLVSLPPIELTAAAVAVARFRGVPVAVDVRDIWPDVWSEVVPPILRPAVRLAQVPYRALLARALRRADAVFACGLSALRWATRLAGREPGPADGVFPHAARVLEPTPAERYKAEAWLTSAGVPAARGPEERLRLVFAGGFTERTGILLFLETFRGLPPQVRHGVRVLVAGRGPLEAQVRAAAARDPAVELLGWLDPVRLHLLYERCDVGLLPHVRTFETGWTLVNKFGDYLAHGLPVLTTLDDDVGRFVREHGCGLVWEPERPAEFAARLTELRDSPDLLAQLRAAARRIAPFFRSERVYGAMLDRLEALARRRGDGGQMQPEGGVCYTSIPTHGASWPTSPLESVTGNTRGNGEVS